jgi:hypothetical protein
VSIDYDYRAQAQAAMRWAVAATCERERLQWVRIALAWQDLAPTSSAAADKTNFITLRLSDLIRLVSTQQSRAANACKPCANCPSRSSAAADMF